MVFIVTGFFQINSQNTLANKISRAFDIDPDFWDPVTGAKRNGPIMLFASNLQVTVMDKPNDYSEAKIKSIVQRYKKESKKINIHRKNKNINKQTLIYILSESFSNPSRVPNMSVNKNPIQNILTTKQSSTSGLMLSSGYGGGTANMEYMTDTSLNLPFFASSLTVPFTQLVPNQDYVPSSTFFNVGTQFTVIQVVFTDGHRFIKNLVFKRSKILRAQEKIN
ncbi:hypothetical protein GB992_02630 [Lactobacillus rossiae]|uniref:Sulfatase N-terminal domain-containing protein n=2 Tax=Furfurilactobacillus TaxID=2767882 RepID=A0A7C9J0K4_9LACO|nr:hypothetical protein [Furfurilactobacillus milii]